MMIAMKMKKNKNKYRYMKRVVYIFLMISILGCQEESSLNSIIEYENIYAIEDDPSDPVKHRIYEIYKESGVPVYFNDTIEKVFIKEDVYGNPVYKYETLDLAWSFSSYSSLDHSFEYMTDPDEQLEALDIIEKYLALSSKALYPYNFFIVKSFTTEDQEGETKEYDNGVFGIYFRTVIVTGNWSDAVKEELPSGMLRGMVKNRITNYSDLLTEFFNVSKALWYKNSYVDIDKNFYEYLVSPNEFGWSNGWGDDLPPNYYFSVGCFSDTWYAVDEFTPEGLENFRAAVRLKVGQFGFISSGRWLSTTTPDDTEQDLTAYINELLSISPEKFNELWGACPLVMKKYNILYDIVVNELGIDL